MSKNYVYGILDSRTRMIVYLGRTKDLENRMNGHRQAWNEALKKSLIHGLIPHPIQQSVECCYAYLALSGREFQHIIFEETSSSDEISEAENKWADVLVDAGHPLCNGSIDKLCVGSRYKAQVRQVYTIDGEIVKTNLYNRLDHPDIWVAKQEEYGIWSMGKSISDITEIITLRNC